MQRPQPQQPQQPQGFNSYGNIAGQSMGGQVPGARPNFGSQITPEMANKFASSWNQGQMQPLPYMPQYQDAQMRHSPEESMAIRQQMQNRPQGGYEYQNPFPQQSQQMMPYNFKGNGNGLL
jgi:hypothetical protein